MRIWAGLAAAALLTGCGRAYVDGHGPLTERAWRARSRWSRPSAVLVQVQPSIDHESDAPNLDWGLFFYDAGTGRLRVVTPLARSRGGLADDEDGVYLVPLPAGDYVTTSLYTTIGGEPHAVKIPGASFESFSIAPGEIKTLGSASFEVRMLPDQRSNALTSWSQVTQSVTGRFEPRMPMTFARSALRKIFSAPDTIAGWETRLEAIAGQ